MYYDGIISIFHTLIISSIFVNLEIKFISLLLTLTNNIGYIFDF